MHPDELRHLQIQAAMRENAFPESELKYIGLIDNEHTYLIGGEHIAKISEITEFEAVDDE